MSTRWKTYSGHRSWSEVKLWWVYDSEDSGDHPNDSVWTSQSDAERRAERLNLEADFWAQWEERGHAELEKYMASQGFEPVTGRTP